MLKYWPVFLLVGLFLFFFHKMFISQVKDQSSPEVTVDSSALPHTNLSGLTQRPSNSHQKTGIEEIFEGLDKDEDTTSSDLKAAISKLFKAKVAFAIQDTTVLTGREFPVKLVLEPFGISKNFKTELQKELNAISGPHKPKVLVDTIHYSGVMEAKLSTQLTFKLMNEPSKKLINPLATTTWNWLITPKEPGTYYIFLDLLAYVKLHGTETPIAIQSWQPVITVNVTTWDKFWNYFETAEGKTEIITKFLSFLMSSGGLYGFILFLKKLKSKNETP